VIAPLQANRHAPMGVALCHLAVAAAAVVVVVVAAADVGTSPSHLNDFQLSPDHSHFRSLQR